MTATTAASRAPFLSAVLYLAARYYLTIAATLALCATTPLLLGWGAVTITSGSMSPRIFAGDVIVYAPVDRDLERGHVIVARDPARPGALLTHRIAWVRDDGYLNTRGDANDANDSTPMPRDSVLGLARLRVPSVGLPVLWLRTGGYLPAVAFLIVTLGAGHLVTRGLAVTSSPEQREPAIEPHADDGDDPVSSCRPCLEKLQVEVP